MLSLLLALLPLSFAQSSGTIHLNASAPASQSKSAGCIILAQIASLSSPNILTSMVPICPPSTGEYATKPANGLAIDWPLTTGGDGAASSLAIYGKITGGVSGATAGCVMGLSQMQAQYLLGRTLEWNNDLNELWDHTQNGFLRDPTSFDVITW